MLYFKIRKLFSRGSLSFCEKQEQKFGGNWWFLLGLNKVLLWFLLSIYLLPGTVVTSTETLAEDMSRGRGILT